MLAGPAALTSAFWNLLSTPWGRPLDWLLRVALGATVAIWRLWPAESDRLAELCNKLRAFTGFRRGCLASHRPRRSLRKEEQIPHRSADRTYRELWVREGVGYALTERRIRAESLHGLQTSERQGPDALPLYTGLGLCAATRLLADRGASPADVAGRFVSIVEGTVPEAYRPVALENLGFAVRLLCPGRLADYDGALVERDPELSELFWHGAGRGLYFSPGQIFRRARTARDEWPALERALSDVSHEPGRRNGAAGLAWALTLVNVGRPEVVDGRLRALGRHPEATPGAAHGVASALMFWHTTTGDRELVASFLDHPGSARGGELWSREVIGPARAALTRVLPRLEREDRLSELFYCRPGWGVDHGAGVTRGSIGSSSGDSG